MTTEAKTDDTAPATKPVSKSAWAKKGVHEGVTLNSGAVVTIKIPNLPALLKKDAVPNDLIEQAISFQGARQVTAEMLKDQWDFIRWIVPITVLSPEISEDDVENLPAEDVEMIAGFASRTIDTDAIGHHLGGLETSAEWRRFRNQLDIDEVLAGV
jgi:hypothetical protein